MQIVKTWIHKTDKFNEVSGPELSLIISQVNNNVVGIWAGNMFSL